MKLRRLTVALVATLALGLVAGPAYAQYADAEEGAVVSDTTPVAGQAITVASEEDDWLPGSTVLIDFFSEPVRLGSTKVRADGTWSTEVTIPADAAPGQHTLRASGTDRTGQPAVQLIALTVLPPAAAAAPPGAADGLARTGDAQLTVGVLVIAGMVLLGGTAVTAGQRRRRRRQRDEVAA